MISFMEYKWDGRFLLSVNNAAHSAESSEQNTYPKPLRCTFYEFAFARL